MKFASTESAEKLDDFKMIFIQKDCKNKEIRC